MSAVCACTKADVMVPSKKADASLGAVGWESAQCGIRLNEAHYLLV